MPSKKSSLIPFRGPAALFWCSSYCLRLLLLSTRLLLLSTWLLLLSTRLLLLSTWLFLQSTRLRLQSIWLLPKSTVIFSNFVFTLLTPFENFFFLPFWALYHTCTDVLKCCKFLTLMLFFVFLNFFCSSYCLLGSAYRLIVSSYSPLGSTYCLPGKQETIGGAGRIVGGAEWTVGVAE